MVAFSRTVPNAWSEHDILAKTTPGGFGIHAAMLDRDLGPLLQTQKLLNSVQFARSKGHKAPLTAAELEMINLTGDGNGLDMVMMPAALRQRVATANFFQQSGLRAQPDRAPDRRRRGSVCGDRRQDGSGLAIAGRQGLGGGVLARATPPAEARSAHSVTMTQRHARAFATAPHHDAARKVRSQRSTRRRPATTR